MVIDGDGRPVCSEMWPGNTADVTTLIPVIDRLGMGRFNIARVCVVADRGMVSAEAVAELEARRLFYILGVRERTDKLVRELALDDPAAVHGPLALSKRGRRRLITRPRRSSWRDDATSSAATIRKWEKDAADRASIVAALERQLAKGDKALVGNAPASAATSKRSATSASPSTRTRSRRRRSSTASSCCAPIPISTRSRRMLCYKQLWTVEQTFRTAKHLFSTRPIFHKLDETIRGHVFCSFLALVLKKALEDRIAALGRTGSWPEIIADLDLLAETEIGQDGKRFVVRSAPQSRRQPRLARGRCRAARPPSAIAAASPDLRQIRTCSAKPPARHGLSLPLSYLANRTVEDGSRGSLR